jgi:hypothetical protein
VAGRMADANIRSDRYTIIRSGIVRHSNTDIVDARNGLALRFAIPVILIEGRRSSPDDSLSFTAACGCPAPFDRVRCRMGRRACESSLETGLPVAKRRRWFRSGAATPYREPLATWRCNRRAGVRSRVSGFRVRIFPASRRTSSIRLPAAYGVPRESD